MSVVLVPPFHMRMRTLLKIDSRLIRILIRQLMLGCSFPNALQRAKKKRIRLRVGTGGVHDDVPAPGRAAVALLLRLPRFVRACTARAELVGHAVIGLLGEHEAKDRRVAAADLGEQHHRAVEVVGLWRGAERPSVSARA